MDFSFKLRYHIDHVENLTLYTLDNNGYLLSISEDKLMTLIDNLEIEDINFEDSYYEIFVKPDFFSKITDILEQNNILFDGEISLVPSHTVEIKDNEAQKIISLLELLDNHDDVQKVHSNLEIS